MSEPVMVAILYIATAFIAIWGTVTVGVVIYWIITKWFKTWF